MDATALTMLAQALTKVAYGLLVGFEAEFAEGYFLHRAGFGVDQTQIAVREGIKLLGRKNLHGVDLKSAAYQRGQPRFVTRGIKEIAEDNRHAGLSRFKRAASKRLI